MIHCFDIEIAEEYGLYPAIILQNIAHWVAHNEANGTNEHDGEYWTFNSVKAYTELFPYLTQKQIRTSLDTLRDKGLIKTGNFNEIPYDRTLWYTLTEKGKRLCRLGNIHSPERAETFAPQGRDICPTGQTNTIYKPYNKPDNKQYIVEIVDYLNSVTGSKYRSTTDSTRRHINARLSEGFTVDDFKAVIDKKFMEWNGTKYSAYLRPETLFGSKFESYLNQCVDRTSNRSERNGSVVDKYGDEYI